MAIDATAIGEDFYWSLRPKWQDIALLLSEFVAGSHVACAQYCITVIRKNQYGKQPTPADLKYVQDKCLNANPPILGERGTTMAGVYRYFNTVAVPKVKAEHLKYWQYKDAGYSKAAVLAAIDAARGGNKAVIVQVAQAYNLPHNEKGVKSHFVAIVAYNSVSGKVLVANGDREPHSKTPDWYPLDRLMDGKPTALLTVQGLT